MINENVAFDPDSAQSYVVASSLASVPAPLPVLGPLPASPSPGACATASGPEAARLGVRRLVRDPRRKPVALCYSPRNKPQPPRFMDNTTPRFGFVAFAETWNGRLAMLGFVIGLGTELLTGQGILSQIGLG